MIIDKAIGDYTCGDYTCFRFITTKASFIQRLLCRRDPWDGLAGEIQELITPDPHIEFYRRVIDKMYNHFLFPLKHEQFPQVFTANGVTVKFRRYGE